MLRVISAKSIKPGLRDTKSGLRVVQRRVTVPRVRCYPRRPRAHHVWWRYDQFSRAIRRVCGLTGKIRQRWVDLPIERRTSLDTLRPLAFIHFASLLAFVAGGVITYDHMSTDAWSSCTTRREGELLHGPICHRRYYGFLILSSLSAAFSGLAFWKAHRRISRAMMRSGPHVRVDSETFWCEQLIEPIRFADVVEITKNGRGFTPTSLTFALSSMPKLAYGKQKSTNTWRGNKPAFTFYGLHYLEGGALLDTIAALAVQRPKQ
jgi:hypothetical protein